MMDDATRREDDQANDRTAERGDVAEADAPTATEENEGMSTILSADTVDGVQKNESDE
jgi:hypothetical protein